MRGFEEREEKFQVAQKFNDGIRVKSDADEKLYVVNRPGCYCKLKLLAFYCVVKVSRLFSRTSFHKVSQLSFSTFPHS